jgi:hypothetical protein
MSLLCVTCSTPAKSRRAPDGYRTCDSCADRIREALQEIPGQYTRFTAVEALLPQVGEDGRRGPGFGSRSPARDVIIALTDRRTTWTADDRLHNPVNVLHSWALMVREEVGERPSGDLVDIHADAALLVRRLDHITRQEWVGDLWREVRETVDQLRTLAGEPHPVPIGRCPVIPEGETKECGTPLFAPVYGDTIRCRGCGEEWPRPRWQVLGRAIGVVT